MPDPQNKRCFYGESATVIPMGNNKQMTQKKRAREQMLMEHREDKAAKKASREAEKMARKQLKDQGIDPDLVNIVPGPHNIPAAH